MVGFVKAVTRRRLAIMFGLAEEIDTAIAEAVRPTRPRLLPARERLPAEHYPPGRTATPGTSILTPLIFGSWSTIGICLASKKHIGSRKVISWTPGRSGLNAGYGFRVHGAARAGGAGPASGPARSR